MNFLSTWYRPALALAAGLLYASAAIAQAQPEAESLEATKEKMVAKGIEFLRQAQAEDGTFSARAGSGITSLAITAAIRNGVPLDDPLVQKGLKAMEKFVQPDGGIYGGDRLRNYETCVAIVCFVEANKDGRYDTILKNAERFVRGIQIGASGDVDPKDPRYGGVGYGGPERPDLSNTTYLIEALHALGAKDDDPAIQRALAFVGRCQNLKGPWNDTKYGPLVGDGGFYYLIPTENVDPSTSDRFEANGGLRSYGSMGYAGFKSLVYAGLTENDPRVAAVLDWIGKHYRLDENPGMGSAGLFYYYHTFGSALDASGLTEVIDVDQTRHDWRRDLITELARRQQPDGSWINSNRQWFENDANLCTAFALLALAHCNNDAAPAAP